MRTNDLSSEWTIDELASAAGVPTRTIREYQRLELLPPPRRDGRIGRYGPEHRARLSIIGRLQERGYSLAAIGDLMGSWEQGRGLGSVLGVDANPAVLDEAPTELTDTQLLELVPAFDDPTVVDRAIAAGLLHPTNGATVARSVALLDLIALATDTGMPPSDAVRMGADIRAGAASIAAAAIEPFLEHVWASRNEVKLAPLLSRARLLMAQAAASFVVHELGIALGHAAALDDSGELASLVDTIAIGQIRCLTDPPPGDES